MNAEGMGLTHAVVVHRVHAPKNLVGRARLVQDAIPRVVPATARRACVGEGVSAKRDEFAWAECMVGAQEQEQVTHVNQPGRPARTLLTDACEVSV